MRDSGRCQDDGEGAREHRRAVRDWRALRKPAESERDQAGFVGGTVDSSTGMTHLGAREYDPVLGRFVSVDPVMNLTDSQQMHGYTYANNNPATFTDPDGLHYICGGAGTECAYEGEAWTSNPEQAQQYNDQRAAKYGTDPSKISHDTYMGSPILGQSLDPAVFKYFKNKRGYKGSQKFTRLEALEFALISDEAWRTVCQILEGGAADRCKPDLWSDGLAKLAEFIYQLTPIPDAIECLNGNCVGLAINFIPGGKIVKSITRLGGGARSGARACKSGSSFVPGTEVLMADGTHKPIEDVEIGDEVLATDPVTGETGARKVTATITSQGRKDLVELTIDIDGPTGDHTATVTATTNHPFWVADEDHWLAVGDLDAGDDLRDVGMTQTEVLSTRPHDQYQKVYNLTINDIHTYYVRMAGGTGAAANILVHNSGPGCFGVGDVPRKVVNSNMGHINRARAQRAGFDDVRPAREAIQELSSRIERSGFPEGSISDTARADRTLVPIGTTGYAVYQRMSNGNAVFKTILTRK